MPKKEQFDVIERTITFVFEMRITTRFSIWKSRIAKELLKTIFNFQRVIDNRKMTKYFELVLSVLLILLQGCNESATTSKSDDLSNIGEITVTCPDAARIIPDYPSFEDKEAFFNDSILYERGKKQRNTMRGAQAIKDAADYQMDSLLARYGKIMGITLSEKNTPAITAYLNTIYVFIGQGIMNVKNAYDRERPFRHFREQSSVPDDENTIGKYSSYPSGHAIISWIISLALSSIDEEHQYDIMRLGYEFGQSRVIVGFHYQSDVDAGRLEASAAYARLVSDPEFIKLMNLAREELKKLKTNN